MKFALPVAAVAGLCLAATAHAGFVSYDCWPADYPQGVYPPPDHTWAWTPITENGSTTEVQLNLNEHVDALGDNTFNIWGKVDSDPRMTIIEEFTNDTGVRWVGFDVHVQPQTGWLVSSLTALPAFLDLLPTTSVNLAAHDIHFSGGTVDPGDTVSIAFRFNVDRSDGLPAGSQYPFAYDIVNNPVPAPEPAALGVLAVGAVGLLAGRRRR